MIYSQPFVRGGNDVMMCYHTCYVIPSVVGGLIVRDSRRVVDVRKEEDRKVEPAESDVGRSLDVRG